MPKRINDGLTARQRYNRKPEAKAKAAEYHLLRMADGSDYASRRREDVAVYRTDAANKTRHADRERTRRKRPDVVEVNKQRGRKRQARKHGLTLDERQAMLDVQGGLCAICKEETAFTGSYAACVDHCHATGRLRGILCAPCNLALGKMKDDPARLRAAADYLEKYGKP